MADDYGKAPAFQLYVKEFVTDANQAGMSLQETGAYIRMMCFEWNEQGKGLPDDPVRCGRMVGATAGQMRKMWPTLRSCFQPRDGRLIHPRLEKERLKQASYRRRQSDAGRASGVSRAATKPEPDGNQTATKGQPETNHGSTTVQPEGQPNGNQKASLLSPISSLHSPISKEQSSSRSKRPIYTSDRFAVFEWQLDELGKILGPHLDDFDLHSFFDDLSRQSRESGLVIPREGAWPWLQAQVVAEAKKRRLPIAGAPQKPTLTPTSSAYEWDCPHTPKCGSQGPCDVLLRIAKGKAS